MDLCFAEAARVCILLLYDRIFSSERNNAHTGEEILTRSREYTSLRILFLTIFIITFSQLH